MQLQYTEPMRMQELQIERIIFLAFLPQFPDAEISLANIGVVKENHGTRCEFGQPGFEVILNRFVSVQSVDMYKRYGAFREIVQSLVESHPQQSGKLSVVLLLISEDTAEYT